MHSAHEPRGVDEYRGISGILDEELHHLRRELDELGIQPMSPAEFQRLYGEPLEPDPDDSKDSDGATNDGELAAPADLETETPSANIGDVIGQRMTTLFADTVESHFLREVAAEQRELIVEQAKQKADLLRHDVEIDNQKHRVRQNEELARLQEQEENIERRQSKWAYQHLSTFARLNNSQASFVKVAVLGIFGIYLTILAVTENTSRQKHLARLDERIRLVKSEIITRGLEVAPARETDNLATAGEPATTTGDDDPNRTGSDIEKSPEEHPNTGARSLSELHSQWRQLERARESTVALTSIGADGYSDTLAGIRASEENLAAVSRTSSWLTIMLDFVLVPFGLSLRYLSNDRLLAIILVSCGMLGSLVIALRQRLASADQRYDRIGRHLLLGFAAGFITLLAMKGGKQVFVNQVDPGVHFFNPWSAAFLGMLTGLFTERAYNLLLLVVDKIEERVRLVVSEPPQAAASRSSETRTVAPGEPHTTADTTATEGETAPRPEQTDGDGISREDVP